MEAIIRKRVHYINFFVDDTDGLESQEGYPIFVHSVLPNVFISTGGTHAFLLDLLSPAAVYAEIVIDAID